VLLRQIRSLAFSPIITAAALVLAPTSSGITEASATRSLASPRTRSWDRPRPAPDAHGAASHRVVHHA
jgi:hypothetical protein